jgi:CDP-2,3-bis-(O-geranylgeranyl)-sn-glycerol synthase
MMQLLLFALWYLLPAGVGNMTPILASKAPYLKNLRAPLDGGRSWRGRRIFGPHKTIRGLVTGIIAGMLVGLLQKYLASDVTEFIDLPTGLYDGATPILLGGLLAAGALLGDAAESFFKRQIGVPSGESWFPFDQTDYIIGACLLGAFVAILSLSQYLVIVLFWFGMHLLFSYIGYILKLKSSPI